ncbi:MAG: hypothetical protein ACREI9_09790 [Nitrospiraceae bacterium]
MDKPTARTMRVICASFCVAAALAVLSCATAPPPDPNTPEKVDIPMKVFPLGAGAGHLPVSAALILPEAVRSATQPLEIHCGARALYALEVGSVLKYAARETLAYVVSEVTIVNDRRKALGHYDLLIEPSVPVLSAKAKCESQFGITEGTLTSSSFFSVTVSDKNGGVLLEDEYRSGAYAEPFVQGGSKGIVRKALVSASFQQPLAEMFNEMAKGLTGSPKVRNYVDGLAGSGVTR